MVPKEQLLLPRASRATQCCKCSSKPSLVALEVFALSVRLKCSPFCQRPLTPRAHLSFGSVDGCTLQIDELRGTKPAEKIDLSFKELGVASAIIIASCIKGNGVLKELKCAAAP